ncbi:MAG: transcriptional repressor [Herpetosiphonaceae bacterium]|nr:transcriptional repressor [Herpetosiphonaceae bacterium]
MPDLEELQGLRDQGFRLTYQRRLILECIKTQTHHVSVDEIYADVSQRCPEMNIATVYRSVQWLQSVGLLRKFNLGKEPLLYEYAGSPIHHHLICTTCGHEQAIDDHVMVVLRAHVLEHYGFQSAPEHLAIFGQCVHCLVATAPAAVAV